MGQNEALQVVKRIQSLSEGMNEFGDIYDLAVLLEELLQQEPDRTQAADSLRLIHMKELVGTFEMGRYDILLIARSQGILKNELIDLTNQEVEAVYKEAKGLYEEGLLSSYLQHLLVTEEKHDFTSQP